MPTTVWNVQAGGNATETIGGELQGLVAEATAAKEAAEAAQDAAEQAATDTSNLNGRTRAELVVLIAGGFTPVDGTTYLADGLAYLGQTGATAIPDLPGLVPAGEATVAHYGTGAGALSAMAADKGYVRFEAPFALAANATVQVPLIFAAGGYVEVADTFTLTVQGTIDSPRQWIFRGDGAVALGGAGGIGETARMVHASWFGAFPADGIGLDQGPAIARAFAAMGNSRESVVEFDIGNYTVESEIEVTRGGIVRGTGGDGRRCTVFKTNSDGFPIFKTLGVACQFIGIQFEAHEDQALLLRDSPCIQIDHAECHVDAVEIRLPTNNGIASVGNSTRISRIGGAFGLAGAAGSSLISLSGQHANVSKVYAPTSSVGPESLVKITGGSGHVVSDMQWISTAIGVSVDVASGSVSRVNISDLMNNQASGTNCPALVKLQTTGSGSIATVFADGLIGTAFVDRAVDVAQGSSGSIQDVVIDGAVLQASAEDGIRLARTAGTLSGITIADGCNLRRRTTPINRSGTISGLAVSPGSLPDSFASICRLVSIADDAVYIIDTGGNRFASRLTVTTNQVRFGTWRARAASTPAMSAMGTITSISAVTGALTGTTGADGDFTVSVAASGLYYFENRTGGSIDALIELAAQL